jgi:hypothetical protein
VIGSFARGLAAGAAGTTVLNAVSYLDMALRGRPASSVPGTLVDVVAGRIGRDIPGKGREKDSRREALGALAGIANGLGTGVLASAARSAGVRFSAPVGAVLTGAAAMAATDVPIAALGVSDPRTWTPADWAADAVPHLAYGAAVQAVLGAVPTGRERATPRNPARFALTVRSALLGVAGGARSSLGYAGPALTSRDSSNVARLGAVASVGAEMVLDKRPGIPDRTSAAGLPARFVDAMVGAGRLAARERANAAWPVVAGAAGAAAGSWGGLGWRRWAGSRMPDWQAGLIEDGVAVLLAALACLPGRDRVPLVAVPR